MPVRIQVNGKPDTFWRINLMPAGDGDYLLYLHGHVRKASGTSVGDVVMKSPQAQQRNLEKALRVLGGGKARFMARYWNAGDDK
jgi:Domain of unknown function (DUF1905)